MTDSAMNFLGRIVGDNNASGMCRVIRPRSIVVIEAPVMTACYKQAGIRWWVYFLEELFWKNLLCVFSETIEKFDQILQSIKVGVDE